MIAMYTLKITLQCHDSYEESHLCISHSVNTERECYNYIEKNYISDLEDPDSRLNFEIYDKNSNLVC